jgi:hypothetical protein
MRQRLARFALLAAALAVAGCNLAPTKGYEGPSRRLEDLSVLKGGAYGEELSPVSVVDLRTIDGASQHEATYLVSVLPGRRFIALTETLRLGNIRRPQYCAFELDAMAGCRYVPRPPSPPFYAGSNSSWEWSVDMPLGIECLDGGAFQVRVPARCGSSAKLLERPIR